MPAIVDSPKVKGLEFHYDDSPQKSPQWLACKRGRIGSSYTWRWNAVSKRDGKTPLKERLNYERELMFERQFNTNFEHWVSSAMDEGNEFEDWAARQYEQVIGAKLEKVGCWYNEFYCASPDRHVIDVNAGVEIKVLKDNSFTEVMTSVKALRENDREALKDTTSAYKHWQQMQGQMWATGWEYIDYVVVNFNSRKMATIRVRRDEEFIKELAEKVQEPVPEYKFETGAVHDLVGEIPAGLVLPGDSSTGEEGW